MEICINEMQGEIEELMAINENMIQVELAEKQKVIDNFQEEIHRQKQQLTILLTKQGEEPSIQRTTSLGQGDRELLEAKDKRIEKLELILQQERENGERKKKAIEDKDVSIQQF